MASQSPFAPTALHKAPHQTAMSATSACHSTTLGATTLWMAHACGWLNMAFCTDSTHRNPATAPPPHNNTTQQHWIWFYSCLCLCQHWCRPSCRCIQQKVLCHTPANTYPNTHAPPSPGTWSRQGCWCGAWRQHHRPSPAASGHCSSHASCWGLVRHSLCPPCTP